MPPPVGRVLLRGNHHVAGALLTELRLGCPQELDQVPVQGAACEILEGEPFKKGCGAGGTEIILRIRSQNCLFN